MSKAMSRDRDISENQVIFACVTVMLLSHEENSEKNLKQNGALRHTSTKEKYSLSVSRRDTTPFLRAAVSTC